MKTLLTLIAIFGFVMFVGVNVGVTAGFSEFVEPLLSFSAWIADVMVFGLLRFGEFIVSGLIWLIKAVSSLIFGGFE